MFCTKCGAEVAEGVKFCPSCGTELNPKKPKNTTATDDLDGVPPILFGVVGAMVPVAGIVLWAIYKETKAAVAKAAGIGALIGFGLSALATIAYVIFYVIYFVIILGIGFGM